jgi:hypothetical protein
VVRRKLSYKNNKPKKAVEFFENGKIHRVYDILDYGTIIYKLVYNEDNINVLDARGSGSEMFLDAITGKK